MQPLQFPTRPAELIVEEEYERLRTVQSAIGKETLEKDEWISWAAHHANTLEPPTCPLSRSYMLPLFLESLTSPTLAWHATRFLHQAITYLNPGQTPVMSADQPLFALAKKLQWTYPESKLGEDLFLVTL